MDQLKGNKGLPYYQEQLWPESLRIFVRHLLLYLRILQCFRIKERFMIIFSFTFILNQWSRDLSQGAYFEPWMPPGNSHLNLWLRTRGVTAIEASKNLRVRRPHRQFYSGYPCFVSLSLYSAWKQSSPCLGFLTRDREMDQRVSSIMDRSEFSDDKSSSRKGYRTPLSNGLGDMDDGIIFPGQCQSKEREWKKGFTVI